MGKYLKFKPISIALLNNAEILNFFKRFRLLIPTGAPGTEEDEDQPEDLDLNEINTKVGITDSELEAFDTDVKLLEDNVNQSRVSSETAKLNVIEKQRDEEVVFFNAEVSNCRKSPIEAVKNAAVELYNTTHVYVGIQNLPDQQETQMIHGLLTDLEKPENKAYVQTLHLTDVVEAIRLHNEQFETLTTQRTANKMSSTKENSKIVRGRLEPLYDDMVTTAFIYSVAFPSTEATAFIHNVNALIDEVKSLYNLRRGIAAANKNKPTPDDERPGEL